MPGTVTLLMPVDMAGQPGDGFGGRRPPARCTGSDLGSWGSVGGRSTPLPDRNVQHCVGWLSLR